LEDVIDLDLQCDVYGGDEGPHHTKPIKEEGKAEKAEQGQQGVEGKPVDGGDEDDDDASTSGASNSDDEGRAPGVGANIGAPSAKGKVEVPKENHGTVVIGLKVYTNRDVGCSVEGRLRMGYNDPDAD